MKKQKYRLAIVEDNPVHYRVPIYKEMAKNPRIDETVYFFTKDTGSKRYMNNYKKDKEIKIDIKGFKYKFIKN